MERWSFALSRRWAGYLALTVVFAIVCSLLGMWQFSRRADARAEIARIDANYDAEPRPLDDVLPADAAWDEAVKWTPVRVTGRYLADEQLLVRNRPYGGQPGFEILTPLRLDDGSTLVVDRGWVPTGSRQDAPDDVPEAPSGEVAAIVRLRAGEPPVGTGLAAGADDQLLSVDLPLVGRRVGDGTRTQAYGQLAAEEDAAGRDVENTALPAARPERDEGPHLSYALQWFVFALLGFVGLGWALRQEYRAINADDPEERERAEERLRRRAARAPDDAESEDAILDAARMR